MVANARPEERFEHELEVFRKEADEAVQHLYAYLTMRAVAGDYKEVRGLYNAGPLFWMTTLRALQTSTFIVLGRIFSQDSEHNLDALLGIAEKDREIRNSSASSWFSPGTRSNGIAKWRGSRSGCSRAW